jgi:hypothetical protein
MLQNEVTIQQNKFTSLGFWGYFFSSNNPILSHCFHLWLTDKVIVGRTSSKKGGSMSGSDLAEKERIGK